MHSFLCAVSPPSASLQGQRNRWGILKVLVTLLNLSKKSKKMYHDKLFPSFFLFLKSISISIAPVSLYALCKPCAGVKAALKHLRPGGCWRMSEGRRACSYFYSQHSHRDLLYIFFFLVQDDRMDDQQRDCLQEGLVGWICHLMGKIVPPVRSVGCNKHCVFIYI